MKVTSACNYYIKNIISEKEMYVNESYFGFEH